MHLYWDSPRSADAFADIVKADGLSFLDSWYAWLRMAGFPIRGGLVRGSVTENVVGMCTKIMYMPGRAKREKKIPVEVMS